MHDFYGTVHLPNEPDSTLDAKVSVDLNRVIIQADDSEIGSWRHGDVKIGKIGDQVLLRADGEELVLQLEGQDFFLDLLGANEPDPKKSRRRRQKSKPDFSDEPRTPKNLANKKLLALEADADQIDRRLAIGMAIAAAAILLGAALTWGPFRLLEPGSFPIGRMLAGFGGLGGLVALYLAYFDRSRVAGAAAAIAAGIVTFAIIYLYARSARLGIGFVVTLLGAQALIAVGVLGLSGTQSDEEDED